MPVELPNGRFVSNGRRAAISCLDCLLEDQLNIQKLYDAFQVRFDQDPVGFFTDFILPTTPKAMLLDGSVTGDAEQKAADIHAALREMESTVPPVIEDRLSACVVSPSVLPNVGGPRGVAV